MSSNERLPDTQPPYLATFLLLTITESSCHLHGLLPDDYLSEALSLSPSPSSSLAGHVRMSTTNPSSRAVVTTVVVAVQDDVDGSNTGPVVLGVLGGIALVFFLVVIVVPVVRWRKRRGSSTTESRASSRRNHVRIISEYHQDAVAPLLEEQPPRMTVVNDMAPMVTQAPQLTPSLPPSALLNRKILQTLPNFDDESSESSLGKPLGPKDRTFPEAEASVRLVDVDKRSASLPPIPDVPSQESTLVSVTGPTSPLVNAFQRSVSLATSDTPSNTTSMTTFRYPSLVSSSSKSTEPSLNTQGSPTIIHKTPAVAHTPPQTKPLLPTSETHTASETWWRVPSMPPIPESVHSGSISSMHQMIETKRDAPQPTARLRDSNVAAGLSIIRHVRELSGEAPTQSSLSRSDTQYTDQTVKSSGTDRDERRMSSTTHGTFGRHGHTEIRDVSNTKPTVSEESGLVTPISPKKPDGLNLKRIKRRTFDYPPEPSPPLEPTPLSAPPPLHSLRPGYSIHPTRPTSQPMPHPQSPEEAEPEGESAAPYGHNAEASSSSEQLLPDSVPLLPELPSLPRLTPLSFDFKLDSAPASRSNSASTGKRSGKSVKLKRSGKGHSKTPSKASTASALSSGTGSKRSLRSLVSLGSNRSGSSLSRSKSRDRTKHSRRVTFGDDPGTTPPPVPTIATPPIDPVPVPVSDSPRRPSRPLPALPAMVITGYNVPLPGRGGAPAFQPGGRLNYR